MEGWEVGEWAQLGYFSRGPKFLVTPLLVITSKWLTGAALDWVKSDVYNALFTMIIPYQLPC